jgi:hypothetical protein
MKSKTGATPGQAEIGARSGCDRRARLNYDDKIEIERKSALRDIDQKI